MAGDWIKVETATPDKPEVSRIAQVLQIDHDAAVGKLLRFWIWGDQQSVDGNDLGVTESFIDRLTNCQGFANALVKVGWLIGKNRRLSIPNFDRHNGQTAKNRALSRNRVKRSRYASSVTKCAPEKRREEKSSSCTKVQETPLPPELRTKEFSEAWSDWVQHRAEIRKPLKPTSAANKLLQLARLGPERAVAAIRHSIGNGWQGIFEPKDDLAATGRIEGIKDSDLDFTGMEGIK